MIEKHSSLMPSRVGRGIKRCSIDIGCIVMAQAVTQKTFLGLRSTGPNFRRVESAQRNGPTKIKNIASSRLKGLLCLEMIGAELEEGHKICKR